MSQSTGQGGNSRYFDSKFIIEITLVLTALTISIVSLVKSHTNDPENKKLVYGAHFSNIGEAHNLINTLVEWELQNPKERHIPKPLVRKTRAITQSIHPYYLLEETSNFTRLDKTPSSPERGMILAYLLLLRPKNINEVISGANFEFSAMQYENFDAVPKIVGGRFAYSNWSYCRIKNGRFLFCNFNGAFFENTVFEECYFMGCKFDDAKFDHATFIGENTFDVCNLNNTRIDSSIVKIVGAEGPPVGHNGHQ